MNCSCKHYACKPGLAMECARGVDIRKHIGGPPFGWMRRLPCVTTPLSGDVVACDLREYPTADELAQEEQEIQVAIARFVAGRSPCCDAALIERSTARFCGKCREWVGRACLRGGIRHV